MCLYRISSRCERLDESPESVQSLAGHSAVFVATAQEMSAAALQILERSGMSPEAGSGRPWCYLSTWEVESRRIMTFRLTWAGEILR